MASLVAPLACGIAGAPSGTVEFFEQGTGTLAAVFSDPEGVTQVTAHVLDASGGITRYVEGRTDVVVRTAAGALVRSFTWGTDARETRVENLGFTGTMPDGSTAPGGRTTVDAALSRLFGSFGAVDGNVVINGTPVSVALALAGLAGIFFNVQAYGAVGDGSTDDSPAVQAAINAAANAGGGVVYFPGGNFRLNGSVSIPAGSGITLFGANPHKSIIYMAVGDHGFIYGADDSAVYNLGFTTLGGGSYGIALSTSGRLTAINCRWPAAFVAIPLYTNHLTSASITCINCYFNNDGSSGLPIGISNRTPGSTAPITTYDAGWPPPQMNFVGCRIDSTVGSAGIFDGAGLQVNCAACEIRSAGAATLFRGANIEVHLTGSRIQNDATVIFTTLCEGRLTATGCDFYCAAGGRLYLVNATGELYEAGNRFNPALDHYASTGITLGTGAAKWSSLAREQQIKTTDLAGNITYSVYCQVKSHCIRYAGTNAPTTLTILNAIDFNTQTGTRIEFIIFHNGASGPSNIAWGTDYITAEGGPALTTTIAVNTVLTFAFVRHASHWILSP